MSAWLAGINFSGVVSDILLYDIYYIESQKQGCLILLMYDSFEIVIIMEVYGMGLFGMGIGMNSSGTRHIQIKDAYGRVTGSISISSGKNKKTKKLKYNLKQISSQILQTKTSFSAARVANLAKIKVSMLKQKLGTGEYDSDELRLAIAHAERIARVAKKRKRHLQEEEKIKQNAESAEDIFEEELDEENDDYIFEDLSELEDLGGLEGEELQKRLQEYEAMLIDLMRELEESSESDEMEELADLSIIPDTCDEHYYERIKKKHRADELKDIVEADMKYLKAIFEKYSREMQEAKSGSSGSGNTSSSSGVSMQLSGVEMPIMLSEVPVEDIGGNIDTFT